MCKACSVFEYFEVDPNVYFLFAQLVHSTVQGFRSCLSSLSLSIGMSIVSFTNVPLDPTVSQLIPVHTLTLPFIIILPCVYRYTFHVCNLTFCVRFKYSPPALPIFPLSLPDLLTKEIIREEYKLRGQFNK
jgi:hypothetical protein